MNLRSTAQEKNMILATTKFMVTGILLTYTHVAFFRKLFENPTEYSKFSGLLDTKILGKAAKIFMLYDLTDDKII